MRTLAVGYSSNISKSIGTGCNRGFVFANDHAVDRARSLIRAHQYVLESSWGDVQPSTEDENAYLATHSWKDYAEWHLGSPTGQRMRASLGMRLCTATSDGFTGWGSSPANTELPNGSTRRIELAAHELLQLLDEAHG